MAEPDNALDENLNPYERNDKLLIVVVDETYGIDDDLWEAERERYRLGLEAEFGLVFKDADIGPGASLPAFATLLQMHVPAWVILFSLFFAGKNIKENCEAWRDLFGALKRFLQRPVYLNRQGAAVLAMKAVFDEMDGIPKSLQLLGYSSSHVAEPDQPKPEDDEVILDAPTTLYLGFVRHIFVIVADGIKFRASVEGRQVTLVRLEN